MTDTIQDNKALVERLRDMVLDGTPRCVVEAADRIEALIEAQASDRARIEALESGLYAAYAKQVADKARIEALTEALTASGDTKAAYMGEFSFTIEDARENEEGEDELYSRKVYVPWTTIKEIMAAILKRAENPND